MRSYHLSHSFTIESHLTSFYLKLQIDSISYHYRLPSDVSIKDNTIIPILGQGLLVCEARGQMPKAAASKELYTILYTFVAGSSAARLREALAFLVMSRRHFSKTSRYQKVMPKSTWHEWLVEHAVKTCQTCMNMIEYEYVALHRASNSTMFIYDSNPRRTPYFQVYSSQHLFMIVHDS